ncbi:unnamed protein product [Acanthosepion pharaonis]|uniref:Uncharacterized protein n=1 Tax=Acanthosepion pharaonis TaxID=158019 RepID=A0A812B789_ACAPH|nr:unnamed protein product [Sepia pharaonis]
MLSPFSFNTSPLSLLFFLSNPLTPFSFNVSFLLSHLLYPPFLFVSLFILSPFHSLSNQSPFHFTSLFSSKSILISLAFSFLICHVLPPSLSLSLYTLFLSNSFTPIPASLSTFSFTIPISLSSLSLSLSLPPSLVIPFYRSTIASFLLSHILCPPLSLFSIYLTTSLLYQSFFSLICYIFPSLSLYSLFFSNSLTPISAYLSPVIYDVPLSLFSIYLNPLLFYHFLLSHLLSLSLTLYSHSIYNPVTPLPAYLCPLLFIMFLAIFFSLSIHISFTMLLTSLFFVLTNSLFLYQPSFLLSHLLCLSLSLYSQFLSNHPTLSLSL